MKKTHTDKLIRIAGDLEHLIMNSELMSRSDIDIAISSVYTRMTETVGAIMLEEDEMSGALE